MQIEVAATGPSLDEIGADSQLDRCYRYHQRAFVLHCRCCPPRTRRQSSCKAQSMHSSHCWQRRTTYVTTMMHLPVSIVQGYCLLLFTDSSACLRCQTAKLNPAQQLVLAVNIVRKAQPIAYCCCCLLVVVPAVSSTSTGVGVVEVAGN